MEFTVTKTEIVDYKIQLKKKLSHQTEENCRIIMSMIRQFHMYMIQNNICTWNELTGLTDLCLRAQDLLLSLYRVYGNHGIMKFLSFAIKFKCVIPKLVELENELKRGDMKS